MPKERTPEEIQEQIKWLEANKTKVRRYSFFDDDNWHKIEIELEVLKENLDEDEVQEKVDSGEWSESDYESARSALDWRDEGDDGAEPKKNWGSLIEGAEPPTMPQPVKDAAALGKTGTAIKAKQPKFSPKPAKRKRTT